MSSIIINDVKKRFGRTDVLHGISIDITDGEFIVIVGPSGCGKSTLLRMVAGLETVTAGELRIDDKRVNELEPMDRDIAMVFQNYALYPHMNVFDNMAYGLKIARVARPEIEQRVTEAARMLQLEPYLQRKPRELSGGQRQRVAMGRAIVRKPAVFLFDEPLSNLDAKLRVQMRLEIKALQKKLGITALYVTHDQVEAMTLADRMIVMNEGRVEQIATPMQAYNTPATKFVASFIGSPAMNFVAAKSLTSPSSEGTEAIGIRPEHCRLCDSGQGRITGKTTYWEALGAETLVHLKVDSDQLFTVRQDGAQAPPAENTTVGVDWDDSQQVSFDHSGKALY